MKRNPFMGSPARSVVAMTDRPKQQFLNHRFQPDPGAFGLSVLRCSLWASSVRNKSRFNECFLREAHHHNSDISPAPASDRERLMANIGIVLVFIAFYLRFIKTR